MKQYIQNFKVYRSHLELRQEDAVKWLAAYQNFENLDHYDRYAVKPEHINSRHIYAEGIGNLPFEGAPLYSLDEAEKPTLDKRSEHAQAKVIEILRDLYNGESEAPDYLNHVSCTHYQSPSAAQLMVLQKAWFQRTAVTHLYHMGCYAALPAIRVSKAYIAEGCNHVDIVHTELCTFHLDRDDPRPSQTVMNTLFADGAIRYSVTSEQHFELKKQAGFEIIAQKEIIVPKSEKEMTWKPGDHGFVMTLSRKVPLLLAKNIETFMREIFTQAGLDFDDDKDDVVFAVHPGGPKIIELVEKFLKLKADQVKHSKEILRTRGNMSSATIPYIWSEILQDEDVKAGTYVATVAFGPGLTLTGAILKLCRY